MRNDLLERIPDDVLDIIFKYIKPSLKYKLTKGYFNKFYYLRLGFINNRILLYYLKTLSKYECYIIKNLNYIKYLIKEDLLMMIRNIIEYKISSNNNNNKLFMFNKPIIFENMKFKNFIDFCYLLCLKYKSYKLLGYINKIIVINEVKISKENKKLNNVKSKNNVKNKNIKWIA